MIHDGKTESAPTPPTRHGVVRETKRRRIVALNRNLPVDLLSIFDDDYDNDIRYGIGRLWFRTSLSLPYGRVVGGRYSSISKFKNDRRIWGQRHND